uniref:Ribosomal protein mS38 C-terminal domain-containing protein n=1 Tax=Oncorhynchus tshawytscha TaxID=74940 RepID=A0A8C8CSM0_ONCTS
MFISRVAPHLSLLCALQTPGQSLSESLLPVFPTRCSSLNVKPAADNTQPPQHWSQSWKSSSSLVIHQCPHIRAGSSLAQNLRCKNVLEIRRWKMNRHKYKKLLKRTKFLRRRWMAGGKRSRSKRFEKDLQRIWMIFNKQSKVSERLKSTD